MGRTTMNNKSIILIVLLLLVIVIVQIAILQDTTIDVDDVATIIIERQSNYLLYLEEEIFCLRKEIYALRTEILHKEKS